MGVAISQPCIVTRKRIGHVEYTGHLNSHGKMHGVGEFTIVSEPGKGDRFQGHFNNDEIHGYGKYAWRGGEHYDGMWERSMMHGHGVFTMISGARWEGPFIGSCRHGAGIFTDENGGKYIEECNTTSGLFNPRDAQGLCQLQSCQHYYWWSAIDAFIARLCKRLHGLMARIANSNSSFFFSFLHAAVFSMQNII